MKKDIFEELQENLEYKIVYCKFTKSKEESFVMAGTKLDIEYFKKKFTKFKFKIITLNHYKSFRL
ncbi:MAG: hypothetical protein ACC656_10320, partial [Candidatus Heimdallarchaeota archaeon]